MLICLSVYLLVAWVLVFTLFNTLYHHQLTNCHIVVYVRKLLTELLVLAVGWALGQKTALLNAGFNPKLLTKTRSVYFFVFIL